MSKRTIKVTRSISVVDDVEIDTDEILDDVLAGLREDTPLAIESALEMDLAHITVELADAT